MLKGLTIGSRMFHRRIALTQRIVWVGKHLQAIPFQPPAMGRDTSHEISLLQPNPFNASQSLCGMGTSSGGLGVPAGAWAGAGVWNCVEPDDLQCLSCWGEPWVEGTPGLCFGSGWGSELAALFDFSAPSPAALGVSCPRQWL